GADDLHVAGAPAEVTLESGADLRFGGLGRRLEQAGSGHDHPRRAEAALGAALLEESLLDGMERRRTIARASVPPPSQALDRRHLGPLGVERQNEARGRGPAVEQDRASAAVPRVAREVRSGEPEVAANELEERAGAGDVAAHAASV